MSEHVSTERMNEALDGALSTADVEPLERHLQSCASRARFTGLGSQAVEKKRLPAAAQPKKTADPPRASALEPKGVWTESSAILPTTKSDTFTFAPVLLFPRDARRWRARSVPRLPARAERARDPHPRQGHDGDGTSR